VRQIPPSIEGIAVLLAEHDKAQQALQLWRAAAELRRQLTTPVPPVYRPAYERQLTAIRSSLDAAAAEQAWTAGSALSIDIVVAQGLDAPESAFPALRGAAQS